MNKKEFEKLCYCLELLAVTELISEKKKELKLDFNKRKEYLYSEEIERFIELAEKRKDLLKEIVKNLTELNYTKAIKFAKENKENYIELYTLHSANTHDCILCHIRGISENYLDRVEKIYKKKAKEIFESSVTE